MTAELGILAGLFLSAITTPLAMAQTVPCSPAWQPTFGTGAWGAVALAGHDDGSGPALFAAGAFSPLHYLEKWNGTAWSWLGTFSPGSPGWNGFTWYPSTWVGSLAVFDSGSGPSIFTGGNFSMLLGSGWASRIATWNGVQWSDLQGGMSGGYPYYYGLGGGTYYHTQVNALTVFDDGTGPALYVGGDFTQAGNVATYFIARWNGASWSAVGIGVTAQVYALTVHDDGGGPALYACGRFTGAGGVWAQGLAKWNGSSWSALGGAAGGPSGGLVWCMTSFNDGSGQALYVGGNFGLGGGPISTQVAKWNGSTWTSIGSWSAFGDDIYMLTTLDDGTASALYAGGRFTPAGGGAQENLLRWNGSAWSKLGSGLTGGVVDTAIAYDMGNGAGLYVGGQFTCADSGDHNLARWAPPSGCDSICEPGIGGVSPCPCSNPPGGADRGCENGTGTGGARLSVTGTSSLANDSLLLTATDERPTASSIVLQGDAVSASGITFGHGVRCTAGALKRLYLKTAVAGSITAPAAGDLSIAARSAALGDNIPPGTTRYYGVYYRDPTILGGCPATSGFNITQQLSVLWNP
jgi:hypothetical protein